MIMCFTRERKTEIKENRGVLLFSLPLPQHMMMRRVVMIMVTEMTAVSQKDDEDDEDDNDGSVQGSGGDKRSVPPLRLARRNDVVVALSFSFFVSLSFSMVALTSECC